MNKTIRTIEYASLNAWPAIIQSYYDGWVLRFSRGYTKRANSVNVLEESTLGLAEKVNYCEQAYHHEGLPAIFRITPLCPHELDRFLSIQGYKLLHPTKVMIRDIEPQLFPPDRINVLRESLLDEWMGISGKISGTPIEKNSIHREILELIENPCLRVSLAYKDSVVCCGLGVLDGDLFGLFDIATLPLFRRQGFGTSLVSGMIAWAVDRGASISYLQVMEDNVPARNLYKKLGYQDLYTYWYRVPDTWSPD